MIAKSYLLSVSLLLPCTSVPYIPSSCSTVAYVLSLCTVVPYDLMPCTARQLWWLEDCGSVEESFVLSQLLCQVSPWMEKVSQVTIIYCLQVIINLLNSIINKWQLVIYVFASWSERKRRQATVIIVICTSNVLHAITTEHV